MPEIDPSSVGSSRRDLLKKAVVAGGIAWTAPVIQTAFVPAAAQSGVTSVPSPLEKVTNGQATIPLSTSCILGEQSNVGRGDVVFTRTAANPSELCVTITLSTGTIITGREVYILQSQSDGGGGFTCVSGTGSFAGIWAASPSAGPQTFCTTIVSPATHFVVVLAVSGGGGNDDYASTGPLAVPAP